MGRRLIVDSGILVARERGHRSLAQVVHQDDDMALAAICVAELWAGVEPAVEAQAPARERFVSAVLESVPVIPYDEVVARTHASLLAHVRRTGRRRGAHDLLVAATAARTGRAVLTTDAAARFGDLPGVTLAMGAQRQVAG